jgi:hypothetical protein
VAEQSTRMTWWRRAAANFSAFLVGLVAAALSWRHIVHTARMYGHEADWAAMLYPVPIDGMMIVGVVMAADDRATGRKVRPMARVATAVGGVLSIMCQVASAYVYGPVAIAVAVIPSGSLIITVEVMAKRGKLLAERLAAETPQAEQPSPAPESVDTPPVAEPAPEPDPEPAPEPEAKPEPVKPRKRRKPSASFRYPVPPRELEVIDATIVGTDERERVGTAYVGPAVVDTEADMG